MDTIKTILNHRSIREYQKKEIPEEILNEILLSAARGSTTGNMQLYSIIVTKSDEMKEKLLPLHFGQKSITEAPVILTFCADFNRFNKYCKARNVDTTSYNNLQSFMWAVVDTVIASQNACIAAEAHNLGICYFGTTTYNADKIIDVLDLPQNVVPITTITIGYPKNTPELTDRLPLEAIIHSEKYNDYSEKKINDLYSEKESLPITQKLLEENQLDSLARIFVEKRYTKADNEHFSKIFLDVLKKQFFFK